MTVKELIEKLEAVEDKSLPVVIIAEGCGDYAEIRNFIVTVEKRRVCLE